VGLDSDIGLGVRGRGDEVLSGDTPMPAAASAALREDEALTMEELAEKKSTRLSTSNSSSDNIGKPSCIGISCERGKSTVLGETGAFGIGFGGFGLWTGGLVAFLFAAFRARARSDGFFVGFGGRTSKGS